MDKSLHDVLTYNGKPMRKTFFMSLDRLTKDMIANGAHIIGHVEFEDTDEEYAVALYNGSIYIITIENLFRCICDIVIKQVRTSAKIAELLTFKTIISEIYNGTFRAENNIKAYICYTADGQYKVIDEIITLNTLEFIGLSSHIEGITNTLARITNQTALKNEYDISIGIVLNRTSIENELNKHGVFNTGTVAGKYQVGKFYKYNVGKTSIKAIETKDIENIDYAYIVKQCSCATNCDVNICGISEPFIKQAIKGSKEAAEFSEADVITHIENAGILAKQLLNEYNNAFKKLLIGNN